MRRKLLKPVLITVLLLLVVFSSAAQEAIRISGTVYDADNQLPLVNATVIIESTSVGVASNTEGEFELNIPPEHSGKPIKISYIGYKSEYFSVTESITTGLRIYLEPLDVMLGEVLVKSKRLNAWDIVNKAIWAVSENYEIKPNKLQCFYREITYEDKLETAVTEALIEVYKSSFNMARNEDQVKVVKVSGATAGSGFNFEGGAFYRINDDIIKNRISFLRSEDLHYYDFDLVRVLGTGDEAILVISFTPDQGEISRENADLWRRYKRNYERTRNLYSGEIYIRETDYAIVKAEYWLKDDQLRYGMERYLTRIPDGTIAEMTDARFTAEYRKTDDRYYLYFTDGQICFDLKKKETGVTKSYRVYNQIITVDRTDKNVQRIPGDEVADYMDMVPDYRDRYDKDFWKDQNIIKAYSGLEMMGNTTIAWALLKDELLTRLNNYWYENPVEKIFLHTDRNRYISGEEIFFKAYVKELATGYPSELSKTFFVLLVDSVNNIIEKVRYALYGGFGAGSMELPQNMQQGVYRLVAYPSYLQNFKPDDCFVQSIEIEDRISFAAELGEGRSKKKADLIVEERVDIQFLPEGGQFVAGLRNNLGVCAVSESGKPQKLKLALIDDSDNTIDTVETNELGLAKLNFIPEANTSYIVRIIEPLNLEGYSYNLPKSLPRGIALSINGNFQDNLTLRISSADREEEKLQIVLIKGKQVIGSAEAVFTGSTEVSLEFNITSSGIASLVVFRGKIPVAERLIFLDSGRRLNIKASPEYGAYPARGMMDINIKVTDQHNKPVRANLSLSVIDSINCISDKLLLKNIQHSFWLESALEKNIPVNIPLYVLDQLEMDNENFKDNIDLLLLTYGWRRFSMDEIMKRNVAITEREGRNYDIISGRIDPLARRRRKAGVREIFVLDPARYYFESVYTDRDGRFTYKLERLSYSRELVWDFQNKKDRQKWSITFMDSKNEVFTEKALSINGYDKKLFALTPDTALAKLDSSIFADLINIPEVTVTHKRELRSVKDFKFAETLKNIGNVSTASPEDFIMNLDLKQLICNVKMPRRVFTGWFTNDFDDPVPNPTQVYGQLFYYRIQLKNAWEGFKEIPALFVVDDIPISVNYDNVNHITPEMVESISIISGPQAHIFFGSKALGGAIMIYLKDDLEDYLIDNEEDISSIVTNPLCNTYREFYKPNYEIDTLDVSRADYRLTLHWDQGIITNENGEATVTYFNAGYNSYVVGIINGMSYQGEPVYHRFRYRV
ncbi:MAG: carboxypeptidase-like regulatory domain-containing protein, partial [Bacteroidales bacterium]|nr:carboxypeptidase-like regulatory domain-containing protein [Bacteroidales bacterium]